MRFINPPACCEYSLPPILSCEQSQFLVVDGRFFQSYKYFSSMESTIREWLTPDDEVRQYLGTMIRQEDMERHKICVHIRRGDFETDGQHAGTEKEFTKNAIDFLYRLTPGAIFIFSNEQRWVRKEIVSQSKYQNEIRIMPTPQDQPFKDLHFSQVYCDTVLITAPSSTFGWWIGYLSKNQKNVYYRDIRDVEDSVKYQMIDDDFYPRSWRKMGMIENNGTIFLKN
ncbi:hypothetical protein CRE_23301 [Caenorhabditis remanei]|uniref:L-Fucosyltransferase n=1 Tax=Caenorhabditis remanei TaxID=31234 RepID=E3MGL9_CAERE|nr:hypothetical protein CRE_23301 [Caenorhabditis remanei]